jgi:hypothetical protein
VVFLPCNSIILHFDSGFLSGLSSVVDVGLLSRTTYICVSCVIAYICYSVLLFFASHGFWEIGFYFITAFTLSFKEGKSLRCTDSSEKF